MRTRVLLIEDGHSGRSVLAQLFGLRGLTVYAFASLDEAADHLETGEFDVALIDGDLQGGEGILAAEELALRWPAMRVVMMLQDDQAVLAFRKRCPGVLVAEKSAIPIGSAAMAGTRSAALCNN